MLFNSLPYALFLIAVVVIYFSLPQKIRWIFLLGVSYFFYMCWNANYALLMLFSTVITFFAAFLMDKTDNPRRKTFYLVFTLIVNLGILFLFKYFNFFNNTLSETLQLLGVRIKPLELSLLLPVGISFYTFQSLGYTLDVYKGKVKPCRHFGKYALFVSFFPQIAAGPINRIESLLPQFDRHQRFNPVRIRKGLLIIAQGLIKKLVIADRLAVLVNHVYDSPDTHYGMQFIIATVFFAFQIYCDFSGYTDMAVGSAKILGYDLMINFKRPYLSATVPEFWKRWHISLTSWFRDYLYIPLGGNRKHHLFNIMVVFLVSGLWHGASLTFIIWGFLNGFYQVIGLKTKKAAEKLKKTLRVNEATLTYQFFRRLANFTLICFAWLFFRANNVGDLKIILSRLFTVNPAYLNGLNAAGLGVGKIEFLLSVALILLLLVYETVQEKVSLGAALDREPLFTRWAIYISVFVIILLFGVYGDANGTQFIYFQF